MTRYIVGDVIAFLQENNVFVHRLIWKKFSGWHYTKGDAVKNRIERMKIEHIVGKVVGLNRNGMEIDMPGRREYSATLRSLMEYLNCRYLK